MAMETTDTKNETNATGTSKVLGETKHFVSADTIPFFIESVSAHGKTHGLRDERLREIESALIEVFDNIVSFVVGPEGLEVTVTCTADGRQRFIIEITDEGKPYNMLLEGDPLLSGNSPGQKMPSVRLMKRLIKNVEYKRYEGRNYLTFTVMPDFKAHAEANK
jgi:anti-sigma regulatory factor (Ser/Thr protein kinase)